MLFLEKSFCYNFKDEIFIYSFFTLSVIYLILYEEVFLGIMFDYLRRKIFYSFKLSYFNTSKTKETKSNGLHFIKL